MKYFNLILLIHVLPVFLLANNISVTNISLTNQNTTANTVRIEFDLSWENSWRMGVGPANYDAAWVFVKFRIGYGAWNHARLNYVNGNGDGHSVPPGVNLNTVNHGLAYGLGVLVYRSSAGSGNNDWDNIQLQWNYGDNGVADDDQVEVQVFAIEMVYIPESTYSLGGAFGSEVGKFYTYPTTFDSYEVTSEDAITIGTTSGNLYYNVPSVNPGDQLGPIPAAYPKGFQAFYIMKYEVSQGQYVSFFNTLTQTQKVNRDLSNASHKNSDNTIDGNSFSWLDAGDATTTTGTRSVNYINWDDSNAYLDWAALRPMTELEYEKACRGTLPPVSNEYAWGNANIHANSYTISLAGSPSERITNPGSGIGNASYTSTGGGLGRPLRSGIFAHSAVNKNREETGASYYGVMEMTGNLFERMISAGIPAGRAFTGGHGDGILSFNGSSNVANWVDIGGYRGGSYSNTSSICRVMDRSESGNLTDVTSALVGAARGVLTAN